MKIVFMGTPDFAARALEAIVKAGHQVTLVVTQPDKPRGRGKEMQFPPVKKTALSCHIPVFQPIKIKTKEAVDVLRAQEADIFVVAAFGQILSGEILKLPKYGCVNIHASLLPKYRGAAPIQHAIINGETESGITIMQMDEGLDTGAMLTQKKVRIEKTDTGESLHDKLREAGAELIVETLPLIEAGKTTATPQDDSLSSYAGRLTKALGEINWAQDAKTLERLVRGLHSWPGCYTYLNGKTIKIWEADVAEDKEADSDRNKAVGGAFAEIQEGVDTRPGTVRKVTKDAVYVQTGEGLLVLKGIQPEGKRRMAVKDFLLGYEIKPGDSLLREK